MTGPADSPPSEQPAADRSSLRLPSTAHAPAAARRFLGSALAGHVPAAVVDTVLLLGSELVTNAVQHTTGDIDIAVRQEHGRVRVDVSDRSPHPPRLPPRHVDTTAGRGLLIMQQLATTWGVTARPGGKTVWCTIS